MCIQSAFPAVKIDVLFLNDISQSRLLACGFIDIELITGKAMLTIKAKREAEKGDESGFSFQSEVAAHSSASNN